MKKILIALVVLMGIALAAGNVLGAGATISGIRSVIQEAPGTMVMTDGSVYFLAWPRGSSYAWTLINSTGKLDTNAVRHSTLAFSQLVKELEGEGFMRVAPSLLPAVIRNAVMGYSLSMAFRTLPQVFIVPIFMLEPIPTPGGQS